MSKISISLNTEFLKRLDKYSNQEDKTRSGFIRDAIEKAGLQFGGGGSGNEWDGFVALNKPRGSTLEKHRRAVEDWFKQEQEIKEYYLTDMIDSWYGHLTDADITWIRKI